MRFIPPFGWARFVSEVLLTDVAVRNRFTGGAGYAPLTAQTITSFLEPTFR
jgi:hypothetical protein